MDGRRNNGGTKGNKGGRPPKADEIKRIEMMDSVAAPKKVWDALWKVAEGGNTQALRTWVEYRYGKPKDRVDITSNDETLGSEWDLSKLNTSQLDALIKLHEGNNISSDD